MTNLKDTFRDEDKRDNFLWVAFISVAAVLFLLLLFVIPNNLRDFQQRAGGWWGLFGVLFIAVGWFMGFKTKDWATDKHYYLLSLGLMFLGIAIGCGFDFDLFGMPDR